MVAPVERIKNLARERVFKDGVDGEVAPPGGLFKAHRGVAFDDERAMAAPRLALAARQRDIKVTAHFIHREGFANRVNAPELFQRRAKPRSLYAVNFYVPILRLSAHHTVTHAAADQQRAATFGAHGLREFENFFRYLGTHRKGC